MVRTISVKNKDYIEENLKKGKNKAEAIVQTKLSQVRDVLGVTRVH